MRSLLAIAVLCLIQLACTSEPFGCGMGAACPTLAEVNGVRYSVSVGQDLVDIEPDLTAYGDVSKSNAPDMFAQTTVYAVSGIDPAALLVARANRQFDPVDGPYLLLFAHLGSREGVWPGFCDYLTEARLFAQPECGAPA